tara:strand:- start:14440 stop:14781 length:342 start_codon:yes stop_codon:yes gene_type:complete
MASKTKIQWKDASFNWGTAKGDDAYNKEFGRFDYTWQDVVLVESLVVDGGDHIDLTSIDKKKKKRLIRLVMRRRGIKMYDETKEIKNFSAHAKDIEFIIKEVKAQIKLENINV